VSRHERSDGIGDDDDAAEVSAAVVDAPEGRSGTQGEEECVAVASSSRLGACGGGSSGSAVEGSGPEDSSAVVIVRIPSWKLNPASLDAAGVASPSSSKAGKDLAPVQ
jgi:hypothetical protein